MATRRRGLLLLLHLSTVEPHWLAEAGSHTHKRTYTLSSHILTCQHHLHSLFFRSLRCPAVHLAIYGLLSSFSNFRFHPRFLFLSPFLSADPLMLSDTPQLVKCVCMFVFVHMHVCRYKAFSLLFLLPHCPTTAHNYALNRPRLRSKMS